MQDIVIPFFENIRINVRNIDGYINGTKMCLDVGKSFSTWFKLNKTREYIYHLYKNLDTEIDLIKEDENTRHVFIHPIIAINIAHWISPLFEVEISKWIYKLFMTGETNFNRQSFQDLERDRVFLHHFLNFNTINHSEEPVFFYVYSTPKYKIQYFIGITHDINNTMTKLQTKYKMLTIESLIYSKYAKNINDVIVSIYSNMIPKQFDHNSITDGLENIINMIARVCQMLNLEHYTCTQNELVKYNNMLKTNNEILFTVLQNKDIKPIIKNTWPTLLKKRSKVVIEFDENGQVLRKKCSQCGLIKKKDDYHTKKGKPGNLSSQCIECRYNIQYLEHPIIQKKCCKCEQVKDVEHFYPSRMSVDRYEHRCKQCRFGKREK